METQGSTVWVEVNIAALKHNFSEVKAIVGESVKIMAVVKADAYGHGLVGAAAAFTEAGANYLGVTTLEEGLEIREKGITTPTLVFTPCLPDQTEAAIISDLDMTVCDLSSAEMISDATTSAGKSARIHVKIDTGMGRLGISPDNCLDLMYRIARMDGIEVSGVYTHFANACDRNMNHTWKQNSVFSEMVSKLKAKDLPTGIPHAANSAALLNITDSHHGMVRPGTILYGQYPSRHLFRKPEIQNTWTLKTRIISLKKIRVGETIGYGSEFRAIRPTIAAVLPIGYADGFTMIPERIAHRYTDPVRAAASKLMGIRNDTSVFVNGKRAKVIGRISMQMCSIDVTDIPGVHVGDEVIVPARRTAVTSRIRRIYL